MDPHLPLVLSIIGTSLVVQKVKILPTVQETRVQSLGREDPLEQEMANHSNILSWRIPWTEEPGGLQSMGSQSWTCKAATKDQTQSCIFRLIRF